MRDGRAVCHEAGAPHREAVRLRPRGQLQLLPAEVHLRTLGVHPDWGTPLQDATPPTYCRPPSPTLSLKSCAPTMAWASLLVWAWAWICSPVACRCSVTQLSAFWAFVCVRVNKSMFLHTPQRVYLSFFLIAIIKRKELNLLLLTRVLWQQSFCDTYWKFAYTWDGLRRRDLFSNLEKEISRRQTTKLTTFLQQM